MSKTIVAAAALVAGIVIAAPMAWPAGDGGPQTAQEASDRPGVGAGGGWHHEGSGPMGRHHGGMRNLLMRRIMQLPPRERCEERLARRAGIIAYTVAKLDLTAAQRPLWDRLDGLLQEAAAKERQLRAALKPANEQKRIAVYFAREERMV